MKANPLLRTACWSYMILVWVVTVPLSILGIWAVATEKWEPPKW